MFFSTEVSFKNLAMEKVSSPIINNFWRACTIVSLITASFLLLYFNQGNREYIRDSLKPTDAVSVSISPVQAFPSVGNESGMNGTSEVALTDVKKNGSLWELSDAERNWSSEQLSSMNGTLEDSSPLSDKNETLGDSLQPVKNETSDDWLQPVKNETSVNSLPPLKNENSGDTSLLVKNETSEDSLQQQVKTETPKEENRAQGEDKHCDVFDGSWVHDTTNSPMYNAADCPFLSDQVSCRRNGRPDLNYESWSWEGNRCEIPRMNTTDMLERLRGKRVIVVGDSLNRNQFESLACLLYSSVPSWDSYVDVKSGVYKIFRSKSYGCSVEFFWAPFLVEMEQKDQHSTRILKLDQINPSAKKWKGADVMIFNTGHWWVHFGKLRTWDMIQYRGKMIESMELESAFLKGMKTWSRWVDHNVDPSQTTVFFRSISPEHKGINWCYEPIEPLLDESYVEIFPRSVRAIVEDIIRKMRTPVRYLNITKLTQYRIDAHTKVYTTKGGLLLTMEQRKKPEIYADCSHWCIPGVPDTWNRLVYASLVLDGLGPNSTYLIPTVSSR